MSFNSAPSKQTQEVIFSRKTTKTIRSKVFFNNILVRAILGEIWGMHMDSKLSFDIHIKQV